VLNSQTNTLPTPDNLRRWKLKRNELCGLCGQQEVTLSHILAGCPWVRNVENKLKGEDRYKWRHNNVLLLIAAAIKEQVNVAVKAPERKAKDPLIKFVRAGEAAKRSVPSKLKGLLSQARDWIVISIFQSFGYRIPLTCFPTRFAQRL
jgi:zinc-binding in reverse transcriptase